MQALSFPFDPAPGYGQPVTIRPGVLWVRMPIPGGLDHINLYLLEDEQGWWVVDTGIDTADTREHWLRVFGQLDKPVCGVIVTHMHPDHIGLAGWICDHFRVHLYISFGEFHTARSFSKFGAADLGWASRNFYRQIGLGDQLFEQLGASFKYFGDIISPIPDTFRRLSDGMEMQIGGHCWRVLSGYGHSPEHSCLFSPDLEIMISGDQVLPKITTNVSLSAMEPEANPLHDWLTSLERFFALPANTLVLPAHNTPFQGLHLRLQQLLDHHRHQLAAIVEHCDTPKTAMQLLPVMYQRELDDSQLLMATGECMAHLNYLLANGALQRENGEDNVFQYQAARN